MAKRKGRKKTRSKSPHKSLEQNIVSELNYNPEYLELQIKTLDQKIKTLACSIDQYKILKENIYKRKLEEHIDQLDTSDYLCDCIKNKEQDIVELQTKLGELINQTEKKKQQHEQNIIQLRMDIEIIEERLNTEKSILIGKITSMEEFSVEREQLYSKINDLERVVNFTRKNNRRNYHEKDLEITVTQDHLHKQMIGKIMELAAEFRKATKQQLGKMEMRTLEKNLELSQRLSDLGTKLLDMFGTNKSFQQATTELEKNVQVLKELKEIMKKKLKHQIKNLQFVVRDCYEKGDTLDGLYEIVKNQHEFDDIQPEDHEAYLTKLSQKEANLKQEVEQLRFEQANLWTRYTALKQDRINESSRLNQLRVARNRLFNLITDVGTALRQALELFDPENTSLSLTERLNRQDRLLASLFILLYTSDRLHERITPHSIGDYRISIFSGSKYHKLFRSALTSHNSVPMMSRSTGHLDRKSGKCDIHTLCRTPYPSLNETDSISSQGIKPIHNLGVLEYFGLVPSERNVGATIRKLSQQLSATSRDTRYITPDFRSIAIQADLQHNSTKSQQSGAAKTGLSTNYMKSSRTETPTVGQHVPTQFDDINYKSVETEAQSVRQKLLMKFPSIKLTCPNMVQNERRARKPRSRYRIWKNKNPKSGLPSLKCLAMI